MNKIQEEIMELSNELGCQNPKMESRTFCPWCHQFTLILKEHKYSFKCLNCKREGSIKKVKQKYYGDIMTKPQGVSM